MKSVWAVEFSRLLSYILFIILLGLITKWWLLSTFMGFLSYIFWHYRQLRKLERWLSRGLKDEDSPDGNGVWEYIVEQIYRRRRVERKQKRKYQQTLARLNEVIAALPYAAVVLDEHFDITWSNSVAERVLGIRVNKDRGQRITNLIRHTEFGYFIRHLHTYNQRLELPSPTNKTQSILLRVTPFSKNHYLLIARDITERVELQRTRKQFVANASHELRTPLSVVSGYLEILEQEPDLPDYAQSAIKSAIHHTERMSSIIDSLLTLAVLENRSLRPDEGELIDIDDKIHQFVRSMANSGLLEKHEICIQTDAQLLLFAVDLDIDSILSNLVKNAIKYTPEGTMVTIDWRENFQKDQACLTVSDNGLGIANEHLAHISERFYRVDAGRDRKTGGTGLGLSIVKHMVERHQGKLYIESELGVGSSFMACFPVERMRYVADLMDVSKR
ncbi:MAG TPA: phosphate regulon sensor histidine kinase PhoR [Thiothrix sp.]|nr:phosphate regulon sensor histidine kinase PhoR [Thiothrix sp.]